MKRKVYTPAISIAEGQRQNAEVTGDALSFRVFGVFRGFNCFFNISGRTAIPAA